MNCRTTAMRRREGGRRKERGWWVRRRGGRRREVHPPAHTIIFAVDSETVVPFDNVVIRIRLNDDPIGGPIDQAYRNKS